MVKNRRYRNQPGHLYDHPYRSSEEQRVAEAAKPKPKPKPRR